MKTSMQAFVAKLNEAFANGDYQFLSDHATDDIVWDMIGDQKVQGRDNFLEFMKSMSQNGQAQVQDMKVHSTVTHGPHAICEGSFRMIAADSSARQYAFCDVYEMRGIKNPKIKTIRSYVIEVQS